MRFQPSEHSYDGAVDELKVKLKKSGSPGFYTDTGGYGWYLGKDLSLILVFAPGGGVRKSYKPGTAAYNNIFAKVVAGKKPVTKETAASVAKKSGGQETSGKAQSADAAAPAPSYSFPSAAAASTPAVSPASTESGGGATALSLMGQPWFWPAVIGGTVVAGGAIWYFFLRTPAEPEGAPA